MNSSNINDVGIVVILGTPYEYTASVLVRHESFRKRSCVNSLVINTYSGMEKQAQATKSRRVKARRQLAKLVTTDD